MGLSPSKNEPINVIPLTDRMKSLITPHDPSEIYGQMGKCAHGQFGVVYKGKHKKTGQIVALKIIPLSGIGIENLEDEIDFMSQLDDKHIVKFYGAYHRLNDIWIVMEYLDCGTLSQLVDHVLLPLKEEWISYLLRNVLQAIKYIHSKNMIHRDIKSHNIMITCLGEVKIVDFGFCCQLRNVNEKRKSTMGTCLWMAPEVMKNEEYSFKCDVWSVGIVAIELADGKPPHKEIPSAIRIMHKVVSSPSPTMVTEGWSDSYKSFIALCVNKDQEKRGSIDDLLSHEFITKHICDEKWLVDLIAKNKLSK